MQAITTERQLVSGNGVGLAEGNYWRALQLVTMATEAPTPEQSTHPLVVDELLIAASALNPDQQVALYRKLLSSLSTVQTVSQLTDSVLWSLLELLESVPPQPTHRGNGKPKSSEPQSGKFTIPNIGLGWTVDNIKLILAGMQDFMAVKAHVTAEALNKQANAAKTAAVRAQTRQADSEN